LHQQWFRRASSIGFQGKSSPVSQLASSVRDLAKIEVWAEFRRLRVHALNPAREFVLPFQLRNGVLLCDLHVRMAGDLAGLDAAAADLLPPRDIGAPQGVRRV
jgi:hypothetical protein